MAHSPGRCLRVHLLNGSLSPHGGAFRCGIVVPYRELIPKLTRKGRPLTECDQLATADRPPSVAAVSIRTVPDTVSTGEGLFTVVGPGTGVPDTELRPGASTVSAGAGYSGTTRGLLYQIQILMSNCSPRLRQVSRSQGTGTYVLPVASHGPAEARSSGAAVMEGVGAQPRGMASFSEGAAANQVAALGTGLGSGAQAGLAAAEENAAAVADLDLLAALDRLPVPEEPGAEDCCQSGCVRCVWDVYEEQMESYERKKTALLKAFERRRGVVGTQVTPGRGNGAGI